ncbi:MAG: phosphate acetyltransferase [Arthrospira sp. PLM2.Bin9]|nr:phosphate acetyltransferase [Arthrospira sp. PLM2.Bin9]TVU55248.1 MAG: phosphate acetyltransferase [Arthrospira sp. PLM2.Bin9]
MAENLYIATIEPGSGKSLVVLGIIELLSKRIQKLGFFRPIIRSRTTPDRDIQLVRSRLHQALPYESYYALTHEEAQNLIAEGRYDEVIKQVIEKYKAVEQDCDFVVCEGTDFTDIASAFEFDFNVRFANHLGCPILIVASGSGKTPNQLMSAVLAEREAFIEEGCTIAATVVNRVDNHNVPAIIEQVKTLWKFPDPLFVIPEEPILAKPTVAEIAQKLGGKQIYGASDDRLNREVFDLRVAAMQVPNFLKYLQEGSLIITPGDRSDIILACLAAATSENYPNIAGIILSGGLALPTTIQTLIDGCRNWTVPIITVNTDTYETAMNVDRVHGAITPDNDRKIASALGLFETHVNLAQIEERIQLSRPSRTTPIMFEYQLIQRAKANRQHIVLPEGREDRILQAAEILWRRGVADITLLGSEPEIRGRIAALGLNLSQVQIIDPASSPWYEEYAETYFNLRKHKGIAKDGAYDVMLDVSYFGTMMVYKGHADGMVSGAVHTTGHTIRPALEFIRTSPGTSIVSSVFLMALEDRILVYGDCAVNPNPNPQQLADIAISSALTAQMFGIEPRVAMLSYSTGESGQGEDVEKVKQATSIARQLRPDLKIEGPIQYDAAIDETVAKTKLPDSQVAGRATVFIFPDLNTGNNTYKAVQRSANAVAIGPILQGLKKPVNDLSRGCTVTDIVNTVAITAIQADLAAFSVPLTP